MFLDLTEQDVFSLFYLPICIISLIIWVNTDIDQFFGFFKFLMEASTSAYFQTITIKSRGNENETQQHPQHKAKLLVKNSDE